MLRARRMFSYGGMPAPYYIQPISRVLPLDSVTAGSQQSNTRIPLVNNTGRALSPTDDVIGFIFCNWTYTASIEYSPTSTLTVRAGVEYPNGTKIATTTDGSTRDITIAGGATGTHLKAPCPSIPNGATFWVNVKCLAAGGDGAMPVGYTGKATLNGGTITSDVLTPDGSDYTTSGSIPVNPSDKGYGPSAVYIYSKKSKATSFLILGDSIARGFYGAGSSVYEDGINNAGYTYLNLAYSGGRVNAGANNTPTKRITLAQAAGCTDVFVGYPTNDLDNSISNATFAANFETLWTGLKSAGFKKIIQSTCLPKTTDATSPGTPDTTPAGAFTGGASSFRSQWNATLRGYTLGGSIRPDILHELADILESSRDSGLWLDPVANTGDGTHPSLTGAGVVATDLTTKLGTWGY